MSSVAFISQVNSIQARMDVTLTAAAGLANEFICNMDQTAAMMLG